MSGYKKKYEGRIESIKRRFKEEKNSSTLWECLSGTV